MKPFVILSLSVFAGIGSLPAQDGALDLAFGDDGIVLYLDAGYTTTANAVLVKPDGAILTAGERYSGFGSQLLMLGYQEDGEKDLTFGSNNLAGFPTWGYPGIVHTDIPGSNREYAHAAVLQPDGRIILGGYANTGGDWLLARYKPNGDLDSTFAVHGYLLQDRGGFESINALVLLSDGKILAGGTANGNLSVARYNADGTPDQSFGNNGMAGLLTTFGDGGRIAVDDSDRIYLCGTDSGGSNGRVVLGRFLGNGSPDNSFGTNGRVHILSGEAPTHAYVAVTPDQKAVVVSDMPANFGQTSSILITRLSTDGSADDTFDGDGKVTASIGSFATPSAILVQSDGEILVTGRSVLNMAADLFVAKFKADGTVGDFGNGGVARSGLGTDISTNYATGLSIALQADDKILVGGIATLNGLFNLALVRFHNSVGEISGIFSAPAAMPLTVYPNPAVGHVSIDVPDGDWKEIHLTDITGQTLITQTVNPASTGFEVNVEGLAPGLYSISLVGREGMRVAKVSISDVFRP